MAVFGVAERQGSKVSLRIDGSSLDAFTALDLAEYGVNVAPREASNEQKVPTIDIPGLGEAKKKQQAKVATKELNSVKEQELPQQQADQVSAIQNDDLAASLEAIKDQANKVGIKGNNTSEAVADNSERPRAMPSGFDFDKPQQGQAV